MLAVGCINKSASDWTEIQSQSQGCKRNVVSCTYSVQYVWLHTCRHTVVHCGFWHVLYWICTVRTFFILCRKLLSLISDRMCISNEVHSYFPLQLQVHGFVLTHSSEGKHLVTKWSCIGGGFELGEKHYSDKHWLPLKGKWYLYRGE